MIIRCHVCNADPDGRLKSPPAMTFVRTDDGNLISLVDVRKIFSVGIRYGSHTVAAPMHGGETVKLARDYTIESLRRVFDPVRAHR